MLAPCRIAHDVGEDHIQQDHRDNAPRDREGAELDHVAHHLEDVGELSVTNGATGGVDERQGGEDAESAKGDDEGRQFQSSNKHAVERTRARADCDAQDQCERAGNTVLESGLGHDHRGEHGDRAYRQVNTGGENHQGLRNSDGSDDRHLLHDQ